jgi:hypothetical protein
MKCCSTAHIFIDFSYLVLLWMLLYLMWYIHAGQQNCESLEQQKIKSAPDRTNKTVWYHIWYWSITTCWITQSVKWLAVGWEGGIWILAEVRIFLLATMSWLGLWPTQMPAVATGVFPVGKMVRARSWPTHLLLMLRSNNEWNLPPWLAAYIQGQLIFTFSGRWYRRSQSPCGLRHGSWPVGC